MSAKSFKANSDGSWLSSFDRLPASHPIMPAVSPENDLVVVKN